MERTTRSSNPSLAIQNHKYLTYHYPHRQPLSHRKHRKQHKYRYPSPNQILNLLPAISSTTTRLTPHHLFSRNPPAPTMPPIPSRARERSHLTTSPPPTHAHNHTLETFVEVFIVIFCVLSTAYSIYLLICLLTWAYHTANTILCAPNPIYPELALEDSETYSDNIETFQLPTYAEFSNRDRKRSHTY